MHTNVISAETRSKIQALVQGAGTVAEATKKLARKAQTERKQRERLALKRKCEQEARERRLDGFLEQIVQGTQALVALGCTKEMRKLINARAAVGQCTELLTLGDERTTVSVMFIKGALEVSVSAVRPSPVQDADRRGPRKHDACYVIRRFPLDQTQIAPDWFWHLFHADLSQHWYDWEFEFASDEDLKIPADRASIGKGIGNDSLRVFQRLTIEEIERVLIATADDEEYDYRWWSSNLTMLRFLADCADPGRLKYFLEQALTKMS